MKKLLLNIALFLLPIIAVWIATEVFYRTVPNNYTVKHEQLQLQKESIGTLVFGDSHAFFGINPEWIDDNTFNASNISQSLYFDALLFEKHVNKLPSLKHVIITIGYASLSQVDNTSEDVWRKYFYANQMDLDVPIISKWDPKSYSLALTRRFSKSIAVASEYHEEGSIVGCNTNGWGNYYTTENSKNLEKNARYIADKHEDGRMDFKSNLDKIRRIINQSAKKEIKIKLVFMPVSQAYAAEVSSKKRDAIHATLTKLSHDSENTTYLNLFQDKRFVDADFYDANHLNTAGAKKCSLIVKEILY